MKNKVAYLTGIGKLELREEDMPICGDDEIILKNEYMGICGSDLFFFGDHAGEIADGVYKLPFIIGHECAGVIEEVGKNVHNIKHGDKVALEPGVPCGTCEFCKSGRYNLCPEVKFMAAPPYFNGAMRRYINFPAHMAFKLPDNVDTLAGALIEPLAIGIHSSKRSGVGLGDTVVILGAGCIGLTLLLSAKARGAAKVIMVDIHDNRLNKAKELGAFAVINSNNENVEEKVTALLDGDLPNFVFEAAGTPQTVQMAAKLVKRGGTILMVGSVNLPTSLKFYELTEKEVNIVFSFRYCNMYPVAIEAVASGKIDIRSIVTDIFDFEGVQNAFEMAERNKQSVVKGVLKFQ
jgi:Threonine dehydrogenase and related Zn-dependent dehydrogenases